MAFTRQPSWLKKYFLVVAVIIGTLLIGWPLIPQKLHYFLIPLIIAIGIRAYTQYRLREKVK